jgi:SAM-dependent methyltransferase
MEEPMTLTIAEKNYTEAVTRGDYDLYVGNLFGKYDNVRIYWEDQLTRFTIRPFLSDLVLRKQINNERVRIVDLGCGAGQGYEILTRINKKDLDLGLFHDRVLPENELDYCGLDISQAMVEKGNEIYESEPHIQFIQTDLNQGLATIKANTAPFDIYFSSYGSLSHLDTESLKLLLLDICEHSQNGSLVVLDLLGRYSVEWPCYWHAKNDEEKFRDYSMSYLYSEFDMDQAVDHFPIRFWTGAEVEALAANLSSETGYTIDIVKKFDRSLMVGRHVDTAEYNAKLTPVRRAANSLHEDYIRTNLSELIINPAILPQHPVPEISLVLDELIMSWNTLVEYCQQRLERKMSLVELEGWSNFSAPLQFALMTIDRVINNTEWMWSGDPRANVIEPQLGYALRDLESKLQQGLGCGHGFITILRITK